MLCQQSGVSQERVDAFDKSYEAKRPPADKDSEPGDDPAAPYHRQHVIALVTERLAADLLRVDWNRYGAEVASVTVASPEPANIRTFTQKHD